MLLLAKFLEQTQMSAAMNYWNAQIKMMWVLGGGWGRLPGISLQP